jgi:hypothetical protein
MTPKTSNWNKPATSDMDRAERAFDLLGKVVCAATGPGSYQYVVYITKSLARGCGAGSQSTVLCTFRNGKPVTS